MPTVKELRSEAKSLGLTGYSKLRKADLEKLLAENRKRKPKKSSRKQGGGALKPRAAKNKCKGFRKGTDPKCKDQEGCEWIVGAGCIELSEPQPPQDDVDDSKPKIVLVGDSVIDNSYWDNIKNDNTGQSLARLVQDSARVLDHSTEELTSSSLLHALYNAREQGDYPSNTVKVGENYVRARKRIGYPYPGRGGNVPVDPSSLNLGEGDVVFVSIGGNDVVLERNLNIDQIMENVQEIKKIYENSGAKFVYIIPYPPTESLIEQSHGLIVPLYERMKELVRDSGMDYLSLEDFDDELRNEPSEPYETGIPEPTRAGAIELAKRIANKASSVLREIDEEEEREASFDVEVILERTSSNGEKLYLRPDCLGYDRRADQVRDILRTEVTRVATALLARCGIPAPNVEWKERTLGGSANTLVVTYIYSPCELIESIPLTHVNFIEDSVQFRTRKIDAHGEKWEPIYTVH